MSKLLGFLKLTKNVPKNMILVQFVSERVNEQFAKKNEQFTHLLFYHEQPEQFAQGRSFVMRDLSNSRTVAH